MRAFTCKYSDSNDDFHCRNPHTWFWKVIPNWRLMWQLFLWLRDHIMPFGWVVDTIAWKDMLIIIDIDIAMFFLVDA